MSANQIALRSNIVRVLAIVAMCSTFASLWAGFRARSDRKATANPSWNLTGSEILLELNDPRGEYTPGIYSFDSTKNSASSLKLLLQYGRKPTWSTHHERFAYVFNNDLWIADKHGNKAVLNISLPAQLSTSDEPPVRWNWNGDFSVVMHSKEWGSKVYIGWDVEKKPVTTLKLQYSQHFEQAIEAFWPVIPLKRKAVGVSKDKDTSWQEVFTTNNPSFSPDGKTMAAEVYPASPMDMKRQTSRIELFKFFDWTSDKEKSSENNAKIAGSRANFVADGVVPPIEKPKPLLVNPSTGKTELLPLWSPTNSWIAFSLFDYNQGYMVPAVVRPDGNSLILLATDQSKRLGDFDSKWLPAQTSFVETSSGLSKNFQQWGNLQQVAAEWSLDGKYLWVRQGREALFVAKFDGKAWTMRKVAWSIGTEFGIYLSTFNGSKTAWIENSGDLRKVETLYIKDAETLVSQSLPLRPSLDVTWMDW